MSLVGQVEHEITEIEKSLGMWREQLRYAPGESQPAQLIRRVVAGYEIQLEQLTVVLAQLNR